MFTKFCLWQFEVNGQLTLTRGQTPEQAKQFLTDICGEKDVVLLDHCRIDAAWQYSNKHPYDWLRIPPLWLGERDISPADYTFKFNFLQIAKVKGQKIYIGAE